MADEFLSDWNDSNDSDNADPAKSGGDREPVHVLVIGSAEGIEEVIQDLHQRGFAEIGLWSRLLPNPNPERMPTPNLGEMMKLYTRYRRRSRRHPSTPL
ncbi:MAG: hypothetical protein HC769_01985 [Cyanobacteria bacterium CRU_2_1]|nr:hypothetical protein [Cyanobacteria bacterium RU_5_0]NJR57727.1 hypothetical protein [Cyanobacteria bacterium CRU_2_1]